MTPVRAGAVILLEDDEGRYAFQLRDNRPDVAYADYWGLFGGWMERGETPEQCIRREVLEELGVTLDPAHLEFLVRHRAGDIVAHVFRYPAENALGTAELHEGQRWEFLSRLDMAKRRIVPLHEDIVVWFEAFGA